MQRIAFPFDATDLLGPRGQTRGRPAIALVGLLVGVVASILLIGLFLALWWPLSLVALVIATIGFWAVLGVTAVDEPRA